MLPGSAERHKGPHDPTLDIPIYLDLDGSHTPPDPYESSPETSVTRIHTRPNTIRHCADHEGTFTLCMSVTPWDGGDVAIIEVDVIGDGLALLGMWDHSRLLGLPQGAVRQRAGRDRDPRQPDGARALEIRAVSVWNMR